MLVQWALGPRGLGRDRLVLRRPLRGRVSTLRKSDLSVGDVCHFNGIQTVGTYPWGGGTILLRSDNQGVCYSINNQSSNLTAVMDLIRELTLLSMQFQVMVKALHIRRWKNLQSDQLSRFKMEAFQRDFLEADSIPTPLLKTHWPPTWQPSMHKISMCMDTDFRTVKSRH